ncbi:MAG: SMI1/KNR4 family protein [Polyangiales bacterium]
MIRVVVAGDETPVFLKKTHPPVDEAAIAAFEEKLGFALPADYREFLLRYNGGAPVVGRVNGRDDDPQTPYMYGDAVRGFFGLGEAVPSYARLRASCDIDHWEVPRDVLFIADDACPTRVVSP